MTEKWIKCGDFRIGSSPEKHIKFKVAWMLDLDKTNTKTINTLKSGNESEIFRLPGISKEDFDAKIKEVTIETQINVVVSPPKKEGKENQVRWIVDYIVASNKSVQVLELKSDNYTLHSADDYETRRKIMVSAYESWVPANEEIFLNLKNETSREVNFLFIDDIITAGLTGFAVAKKVHELTEKVIVNRNEDGSRWSSNFKFLCLAKIK